MMLSRFKTIAQIAIVAAFFTGAMPLRAQKSSSAKPKASQSKAPAATKAQTKPAAKVAAPSNADTVPQAAPPDSASYIVSQQSVLRAAPGSSVIGALQRATNVEVLSRDRGWTRVRLQGWVPDSILTPADTSYRAGLSAADLRADPATARGKTVVWTVEFLALQTADPLRQGLTDGEPYILARGPNSENALLYLVVPPSLMGTARALQPLAKITVTARVRDGRSEPVGIPILDIQTIRRIR
jgi:hypothetical protein